MSKKQKLELTWIGKENRPKLEPRILLEDVEKSCHARHRVTENDIFDNRLIFGDNLLALKALEQEFAGKIKCIYIDPPFNTGVAFEHYEDGLEHSIWLGLMFNRIKILNSLLAINGCIFVHLDDNESDYLKIILDEVFGRDNFINRITIEARSPSAFSTVNPGMFKASEYLLWYAKHKPSWESRTLRIPSNRDTAYNKYIINRDKDHSKWEVVPLRLAFLEHINADRIEYIKGFVKSCYESIKGKSAKEIERYISENYKYALLLNVKNVSSQVKTKSSGLSKGDFEEWFYGYLLDRSSINYSISDLDEFVFQNSDRVFRPTEISDSGAGQETVKLKYESKENPNQIFQQIRNGHETIYILNGQQISFYQKNVCEIDGKYSATKLLTNIWTDISWEGIAKEGGVTFKKGKKPEALIKRCLELSTDPGDIVLDSFAGSGTTGAVAQKMGRRWIMVELGEHCQTHIIPRLKKVIEGKDQSGISKSVSWKGGGGFRYYRIAPSLLEKDKWGNWIINKKYKAAQLAEALCKIEGFTYAPSDSVYWQHGYSTERDFIYVTTQNLSHAQLQHLSDEVGEERSLLVLCSAFRGKADRYPTLTIKKIPRAVLAKCEWGKDDYSLNVENLPDAPPEPPPEVQARKRRSAEGQQDLFVKQEGET